ncbi:MAG: ATPase, T2SS/T4P/T4SS family [Candidatus Binatia bacterium]
MAEFTSGQQALLRFLLRQRVVTPEGAAVVEALCREEGISVPEALERQGIISDRELAERLAPALKLRLVDLASHTLDPTVTRLVKETLATRYEVVPLRLEGNTLDVATVNPLDLEALKAIEFATGKRVQFVVASRTEIRDAVAHTYRLEESLEQFLQNVPDPEIAVAELQDDGRDLRTLAHDAELPPVVKLSDLLFVEGVKAGASDVHVEPTTDGVIVRYRIDGILEEGFHFPKWVQNPLVARLKVMARMDIAERRVPQDGRIQVRYQNRTIDFRVSTLPMQHGEKVTLRILDATRALISLDRLGLGVQDQQRLREAAAKPQGMILVTGPTGSGKTTTLYALIRAIRSTTTNIITIENPVEYQLKGINQVDINERQGLTFASVLRSVLRQDPDVILVGEIRDQETARVAFQAAQTGHLVLSTLHTNDSAATITRLIDLGIEPYVIASSVNLIMAQRLARRVCQSCATACEQQDELVQMLRVLARHPGYRRGEGCPACRQSGYASRVGIYEIVPISGTIARMIESGAAESSVRQEARVEGYSTLTQDAVQKLTSGVTTGEEILRVVQIASNELVCSACQKTFADGQPKCPHCGAATGAPATSASPAAATPARSFKALVVDDNADIRNIVRIVLQAANLGLTVITAQDGIEAVELADLERPDIVILDVSMPTMDGFEVCRRLRSDPRTAFVPVLMLTANGGESHVTAGFGAGADDYVVKPFKREELVARVRRMLERTYGKDAVPATAASAPAAKPATQAAATTSESR